MSDVRRADLTARRRGILALVVGTCIGALLIIAVTQYRIPLNDWVLADPSSSAQRLELVFLYLAVLLLAPLFAFAAYLWLLSGKVVLAREFPPPGVRVIRDTPVVTGKSAVARGRLLQVLALGCGIAAAVLAVLLWRFQGLLVSHWG